MRFKTILAGTSIATLLTIGFAIESQHFNTFAQSAQTAGTLGLAVGPQYDTTHVYVPAADFYRFVTSVLQTFGGKTSQEGAFTVTPTPSSNEDSVGADARGNTIGFRIQDARPVCIRVGAHSLSGHGYGRCVLITSSSSFMEWVCIRPRDDSSGMTCSKN